MIVRVEPLLCLPLGIIQMRGLVACTVALSLIVGASASAAPLEKIPEALPSNAHAADERAITSIILEQDNAWNTGDGPLYVSKMLPDVTCTNIVGVFFANRDSFAANMSGLFSGQFKGSINHQTIQSIRFITPDIAVVDSISSLSGMERVPVGAQAVAGTMHSRPEQVMVRRADGWRIISFHNVTINPRFLPKELQ
jgi:uncharacterized protein (TIGR02246 family)